MNLSALIKNTLLTNTEPDPHKIAKRVAMKLTSRRQRDEALVFLLGERVRIEMGAARRESENAGELTTSTGPTRLSVVRQSVAINGVWKMLPDCTIEDCLWLAEDYETQAQEMTAKATLWRKRADDLEAADCDTLGELINKKKKRRKAA